MTPLVLIAASASAWASSVSSPSSGSAPPSWPSTRWPTTSPPLALGLIAGLGIEPVWLPLALMALILLVMFVGDHPRVLPAYRHQTVILDRAGRRLHRHGHRRRRHRVRRKLRQRHPSGHTAAWRRPRWRDGRRRNRRRLHRRHQRRHPHHQLTGRRAGLQRQRHRLRRHGRRQRTSTEPRSRAPSPPASTRQRGAPAPLGPHGPRGRANSNAPRTGRTRGRRSHSIRWTG